MDVNTRRLNSKNNDFSSGGKISETRCRPLFSRKILSEIVTHIKSNPEPRIEPIDAEDDLTSEVPSFRQYSPRKQLFKQEPGEDFDHSTMKFNRKSERVSDSYPQKETSGVAKRPLKRDFLKHSEAAADVLNIPLTDKKPLVHEEKHNRGSRDGEPSSSKHAFSRKCTEQFMERMSTFPKREPGNFKVTVFSKDPTSFPITEQSSVQIKEESTLSTSSVGSCELYDNLVERSIKRSKSQDDFINESSPADERATPHTVHASSTNEDCVSNRFPVFIKKESQSPSPPSESQSYSKEHEFYEGRKETFSNRKVLGLRHEEKPLETMKLPDMSLPPPSFGAPFGTPVTSKHHTPRKERHSRFSPRASPLPYDRSRSCNRLGGSPRQESPSRVSNRKSIINTVTNWRSSQEPSLYQYPGSGGIVTNLHRNSFSKRSFESLHQESRYEMPMTRAPSYDNVSTRSTDSERSFLHYLSREADQQAFYEGNYGGLGTPAGGYERTIPFGSPYYNHFSPYLSPSLLPRQEADDPLEPNLRGHQLLGDSQFLRFSKQILGKTQRSSGNMTYLGLCVSGQTIQDLLYKIKEKFYPVGEKVVVMIGTNNFLRNHSLDEMTTAWDNLISHLLSVPSRKLLLLTVPPIPKFAGDESHKIRLKKFNTFIKGYAFGSEASDDVRVADISQLFYTDDLQCRVDLFESSYGDSRPDLVHLNILGFTAVRDFLFQKKFL